MEPEDTSICLGDVAHPDTWRKRRTLLDLRNCPGRRLLGIGNHDMLNSDHLRNAGFVDQHPAALCATDPPLALTHMPLREPPPGAVNVHGHLHDADAPSARHFQRQRRTHRLRPRTARPSARDRRRRQDTPRDILSPDTPRCGTPYPDGADPRQNHHHPIQRFRIRSPHPFDTHETPPRASSRRNRQRSSSNAANHKNRHLTTSSDAPSAPLPHTC